MKNFINKVCDHSKKITVKLKRHHKKFLFGALCCGLLAMIGTLFFSKSKADNIIDYTYSIRYVSHTYEPNGTITLRWQSYYDVNVEIFLRNEGANMFSKLGEVSSTEELFNFTPINNDGDTIVKLKPRDGSQQINYTCHLGDIEDPGTATGMTITLNPGWNVVSTPALLSNISFSNGGNGITFFKLENGQWTSVMLNTGTFTPLEGFLAKNSNTSSVEMVLIYRDTTPNEDMLSKNVSRGRNLLGVTTLDNPFYNIHPGLHLDFTKNAIINLLNSINTNYIAKNGTVNSPEIGEAYGIFLSSDGIYGGSNNRYGNNRLYNDSNYSEIIGVTPGSYNIPLLKGKIITDRNLSFRNSGFYIEIDGANANEDIVGYAAGGIIYDIVVNVGEVCTTHIDSGLYLEQTDATGHKRIYIPLFETCNTIPAGSHKISVLLGINSEYAANFKTGMTITMNSLNGSYLNGANVNGEIKSSVIEVSHDHLPSLSANRTHNQAEVNVTTSETQNFGLGSININANESGETASVLFDTDRSNGYVPFMYVDTYINGDLVNSRLYDTNMIKILVPLAENTGTKISFVGRFENGLLPDAGSFVPKIIVNSILKDGINYITQNCHYYRGRCTQFNGGNYIFNGGLYNVNGGGDDIEGCPVNIALECIESEDYDACIYNCSNNVHQYSADFAEGYEYAYAKGLTTMSNINSANLYGNITKMSLAKIMVKYAIDVLGLTPDTSLSCDLPNDITQALDAQYDNAYTKLCQLKMILEPGDFQPNTVGTFADFGTWLSRALNASDPEFLNELNATSPYYSGHLNWLKSQGIISQTSNPYQSVLRGFVFVMLMRADETYTPNYCTAEELLECVGANDPDACIAACNTPTNNDCTAEELLECVIAEDYNACIAEC